MNDTMKCTLAATLIATAVGTAAWLSAIARAMWPDHPNLGVLLITVFTGIVVSSLYPTVTRKRS